MSKKSNKKSFSQNLELLFEERLVDDNAKDNISIIENASVKEEEKRTRKSSTKKKSFSNNLEQFFKDSIEGVLDGIVPQKETKNDEDPSKSVGLDLLIRKTTAENINIIPKSKKPKTKRVTVFMETGRLETLKELAKQENRRLQQIIRDLVASYIHNAKLND